MAVSPQLAEHSAKIVRRNKLEFDVLSDLGNAMARQWGLAFTVGDALRETYQGGLGLDLVRFNGDDSWTLPMAGRFIIGQDARVVAADCDPDYTRRPEPEATVELLRKI